MTSQNSRFGSRSHGDFLSRNDYNGSHGKDRSRRNHDDDMNEEPEWFTSGPESQSETIELHGFDKTPEKPAPPAATVEIEDG